MRQFIFYLIIFSFSSHFYAQQTPVFSEYNNNQLLINKAFTGLKYNAEVTLGANAYLNDIDGSPKDVSLTYHMPIPRTNMGIGAGFIQDGIGVSNISNFFVSYSYHIRFDHKSYRPDWDMYKEDVISFGISLGGEVYQENLLELNQSDDPHFDKNTNAFKPNIGAGILLNRKNFYLGFSASNLINTSFSKGDEIDFESPFFGYFGYRFYTSIFEESSFKPSFLVKYVKGAPVQADFNIAYNYKNKFEIGTGYRTQSNINFLVAFNVKENFKFAYNYRHGLIDSPLKSGHGILLNYGFK